jgi:hypothetical protein
LVERKQAGESQPGKEALCVECGEEDGGWIVAKEEDDGIGEVLHASICELDKVMERNGCSLETPYIEHPTQNQRRGLEREESA